MVFFTEGVITVVCASSAIGGVGTICACGRFGDIGAAAGGEGRSRGFVSKSAPKGSASAAEDDGAAAGAT